MASSNDMHICVWFRGFESVFGKGIFEMVSERRGWERARILCKGLGMLTWGL